MTREEMILALHMSIDPVAQQVAFLLDESEPCHACAVADEIITSLRSLVADMQSEMAEMSASYQRLLAQREELYRQLNGDGGKTQHCPQCRRSLPLDRFDKSERGTRQGVQYVCRECQRVSPCSAHGATT